jgi:chemotaxis signal transduction protein
VPTDTLPLLVPSACMAEVVALSKLTPVPQAPLWLLGVLNWRLRPVPVISYDLLAGGQAATPGPRARVVVLYPLPGRESWEFVGLMSSSEPQSRLLDTGMPAVAVQGSYPCIATGVRVNDRLVGIPDFSALARLLYQG